MTIIEKVIETKRMNLQNAILDYLNVNIPDKHKFSVMQTTMRDLDKMIEEILAVEKDFCVYTAPGTFLSNFFD